LILGQAIDAGIKGICIVICPGDAASHERAAGDHTSCPTFIEQGNPSGYGDGQYRVAGVVGDESFLHLVCDHLYIIRTDSYCSSQLDGLAEAKSCAVSAVQPTREQKLSLFGVSGGPRVPKRAELYGVATVIENQRPPS